MRQMTSKVLALQLVVWLVIGLVAPTGICAPSRLPALSEALAELRLPTYIWPAKSKPKAIVLGLHGGCLHGRAYNTLANALKARDYTFVSMDMRGFGSWYREGFGTRRDTTFHYGDSLHDIEKVLRKINCVYPNVPVFIVGESLGANVGVIVAANNPELVDGIVAVSFTCSRLFLSPRMVANSAQVITRPTSRLNLKPYLRQRLGSDQREVQAHLADPLAKDEQSITELLKSFCINMKGQRFTKRLPPYMPVLVISGEEDRLSNTKKAIKLFARTTLQDVTFVTLPRTGHLLVETKTVDRRVMTAVNRWFDSQTQVYVANRSNRHRITASSSTAANRRRL